MDSNHRVMVCIMVYAIVMPGIQAFLNSIECSDSLFGCGFYIGGAGQGSCCECIEYIPPEIPVPATAHCIVFVGASCCSCVPSATSLSANYPLIDEQNCACARDTSTLRQLLRRAKRISKRTIRKCGEPVDPHCVPTRTNCTLNRIADRIAEISVNIREDCQFVDYDVSSSGE